MKELTINNLAKNIFLALAVAFFVFLLLNITFIFYAAFQGVIIWIFSLFILTEPEMEYYWFPALMHGLFVVVIGLLSYVVFKSRIRVIYKAIYLTVPVAVVLASIGMFLSRWLVIVYSFGSLFCLCTLYYLYRKKLSWLYYYTVILVAIVLAIFTLSGGEI